MSDIGSLIEKITVGKLESVFEVVTVKEVVSSNSITVKNVNGLEITNCKTYTTSTPNNTFIQIPKIDSKCLMFDLDTTVNSNYSNPYVFCFSDLQEIILLSDENEGLVKVNELTHKLNALEKDLNELKTLISNWIPVNEDGGASLKAALTSYCSNKLELTNKENIQNENVKH
jgi:hypothetical protein